MDASTLAHLFEPFFTTKPSGKGTGLGLALVYGVIQQSAGQITVRSELNQGTTFTILLPRDNAPIDAVPTAQTIETLPTTRGSERVLLIEPDDLVRKMVAGILTADGYHVYAAANATEALGLAKEATEPIQLLIAALAESDTAAVARTLLARRATTRLLDIGSTEKKHTLKSIPALQIARLQKPFALSELLNVARQLLDS
jgi:CheY-like chemotaxis protein